MATIIALAASPMTAAILVETHCLIVAFGSSTSILPAPCAGRRTQFTMSTDSPRAAKGAIYNLSTAFSRPENSRMLWRFCHALPCREAWRKPVIERRGGFASGTRTRVFFHEEHMPEGVQSGGASWGEKGCKIV